MSLDSLTLDATPAERAAHPITFDAVASLVDWYLDGHPPPFSPLCLGWSLRQSLGDDGYSLWTVLMLDFDEYEEPESYPATWASFDRQICEWADTLVIDEMNKARWHGWQPPADIQSTFDRLAAEETAIEEAWKKTAHVRSMLADEMESLMAQVVPLPKPEKPIAPLVKSAADLQHKTFAPVRYLVPGYIAEGCTILAGKPKLGKSWLMLDASLAVAGAGYVLGAKAVEGDVLYLALEDNERRLKTRIQKVLGPFVIWPQRLTYATEWPRADEGGLDQIEAWIKSVAKPTLVVVDVLQRFRAAQGGTQNAYAVDYAAVAGLQALASKYNVAVVVVHHLRKNAADNDPFDKVSGTLGLSGAADSILILDRDGSGGTVLYGRGRDIEEIETAVRFDSQTCRWTVLGAAHEIRKSDERKTIIGALTEAGQPMSPADIAAATGMQANNVRRLLFKMVRDGEIGKDGKVYTPVTPGNIGNAVTPRQHIIPPPPR